MSTERLGTEQGYRHLMAYLPEVFYRTDREGTITMISPSVTNVLGYPVEAVVGMNMARDLYLDRRHCDHLLEKMARTGTVNDEEVVLKHRDGHGVLVSVTARVAHDFNNILAAIIGYTELARMDMVEDTPLMENINKVLGASYRARDLVAQILAFSRQTEQTLKPVTISTIVKEVLKLLRASLPATIEIRQRILLPSATILADVTQIHQVLMNICTNAGHAMRSQGGILEVYLGEARDEFEPPLSLQHLTASDHLCLAIRDTGHGMPPDVIERIFDPYFTTKKKEEGTGLGLAVVHGIVTSHNGHITVESTPGEGTTFKIYFPIIFAKVFDRKQTLGAKLPGGAERVMLIDDEVDIVQVNRQMLERLGYTVTAFTDSAAAVAAFESDPHCVDLLITDMTMPGLTGDHVVRAALTRRPDLPIIMCTGFSEIITKEKALGMGVRKLMMKLLSLGALARTIRELLD